MEIRHIEEFLEISECGNFLESADNLEISQSALSKHIQALEKELGTELFNRTTRKVFLSEAGKIFLPFAEQLDETYQDMQVQLKEFIAKNKMKLRIGCSPLMGNYGIMQIITDFKKKNPEIEFDLIEYNNYIGNDIGKSLLDFEFDIAFWSYADFDTNRFECIEFCVDSLVALLPADHPLCAMKEINLKLLAREKLLLLDYTTPVHEVYLSLFRKAGFEPKVFFSGVRIENFVEMVHNRMGIAILPEKFITGVNKNFAVIRKITPTDIRPMSFIRVQNRHHSAVSGKFWNFLKEFRRNSRNN